MGNGDIRWIQRFNNYKNALHQLEEAILLMDLRPLSRLEKQGAIQAFEFTHELAWKTLKDFLEARGNQDLFGSRDVTREAFKLDLIEDGQNWMEMIKSRNLTSHTYDESTADEILEMIKNVYFNLFKALEKRMSSIAEKEQVE